MSMFELIDSLKIQVVKKTTIWLQNLKLKIQNFGRVKTRVSPRFIQFSDFFWCDKYLSILGYSVIQESQVNENRQKNLCFVTMAVSVLYVALLMFSFVLSVLNLMDGDNLFIAIENIALSGAVFLLILEWYLLLHNGHEKFMKIMAKVDEHYPHNGIDQVEFNTEKYLKWLKIITRIHLVLTWSAHIQFPLMPFLHQIYGWMRSKDIAWEHVMAINLPFDTMHPLFYWPKILYEFWLLLYMGLIFIGNDMLYTTLTHLVTMELNNLAQIISEIDWDDEDEEGEKKAIDEIKKLSGIHQQLIEVTDELDDIYSPLLFINAFSCLLMLCTIAFLTVVSKISMISMIFLIIKNCELKSGGGHYFMIKYTISVVAIAWKFFIQCHFGNALTDASLKVSDGVYKSAWHKASSKYRKLALLFMMRAQKAQKITGWKFIDINMETFYWFIQTAHSYYSFLSGVYDS
ncbi:hypothetical protein PVAND_017148 [Polypedilum vanderplanki]|uniref:Odorant receptor n=1 Tax=Polypedilum vanderplanki TaxID=319348 RepID=A0A9J6BH95_POLVA|nr:hypothetical protein PVAND_017148 [Polypedilum vanderplanki]